MSKKQFTLDSWLKDKSQKVVTRCGFPVRIVCTDVKRKDYPILALVERDDQEEYQSFTKDGRFSLYNPLHDNFDLFIETEDEVSEDEKIRKRLIQLFQSDNEESFGEFTNKQFVAWLEKQGQVKESHISQHENRICKENDDSLTSEDDRIREALVEMVHDTTGDDLWIDYNVHKEEALDWLERQGEHANFRCKAQVGDRITKNKDGVLVNLSQLKRVAKPSEKQGEKKPLGYVHHIDEDGYYTKEAILEPNPYTGTGFDYKGHHWGMCARDGGVEILIDGNITSRVFPDKNNIIEQKPTDSYCKENCKGYQETGKCFADGGCNAKRKAEQKTEENKGNIGGISPKWSVEDEENFCSVYLDVKSARQNTVNSLSGELKEQEQKRMDEVISWLRSLKGRVLPKQEWNEEDEQHIDSLLKRLDALCRNKFERTRFAISEDRDWLKSLRPQNRWKPSDEQMMALLYHCSNGSVLTSLYNDLNKLKGEV